MHAIIQAVDTILCLIVMLAALDGMRSVYFFEHPVMSVAFFGMAVGSFTTALWLMLGNTPSPGTVLLHIGLTALVIEQHRSATKDEHPAHGVK